MRSPSKAGKNCRTKFLLMAASSRKLGPRTGIGNLPLAAALASSRDLTCIVLRVERVGYHFMISSLYVGTSVSMGFPVSMSCSSLRNFHRHPSSAVRFFNLLFERSRFLRDGNVCESVVTETMEVKALLASETLRMASSFAWAVVNMPSQIFISAGKNFDSLEVVLNMPMLTSSGSVPSCDKSRSFASVLYRRLRTDFRTFIVSGVSESALLASGPEFLLRKTSMPSVAPANWKLLSLSILEVSSDRTETISVSPSSRD